MDLEESPVKGAVRLSVEHIGLENFRNYELASMELSPGLNIVFGKNAQGKTNLLEAVHLLSTTRILRGSKDAEAIREGCDKAQLRATLSGAGTELGLQLQAKVRKRAFLNGMALPRASDLLGRAPSVCFSASSIPIVRGEPSDRRLFLDIEISQVSPSYLQHLSVYKRALEQRNALLRLSQEALQPSEHFEAWECEMACHGSSIRALRAKFLADLRPHAGECYAALSGAELMSIAYEPHGDEVEESHLLQAYARERARDILRGTSTVGPHRDSFSITIANRDARAFGSQGQQRTAVIALKLGVLRLAAERLGFAPILLLDDVFSDLDLLRRGKLLEMVDAHPGQVLITGTEVEQVAPSMLSRANLIEIRAGQVFQR